MSRKHNEFYIFNDIIFVKYSNIEEYFICDLDDWNKLKQYCWWGKKDKWGIYAVANINGHKKRFHRLVMNCPNNLQVDHKVPVSCGVCDNRKSNLRVATNQQNSMNCGLSSNNKSGYKGVHWDKSRNKWIASIKLNYKTIHLGRFDSIEDAINARQKAEIECFGEFMRVA